MSENSKIEWTDHTFNPLMGCTKVSPGCAHCYAEELMDTRYGKARWGKGQPRVRTSPANWRLPLKWNRGPFVCGTCAKPFEQLNGRQKLCEPIPGDCCQHCNPGRYRRTRVFCASLADWLDDEVPIEWLADLLKLIHDTPNLDWLLLTKRPQLFHDRVFDAFRRMHELEGQTNAVMWAADWWEGDKIPSNVWIGTSIEDQQRADERIPELLKIPAKVRFLSVEPMLGRIDLAHACFNGADSFGTMPGIHWAIFGGESGKGARNCAVEWIRDGVRRCREAGVAPFVKQLGSVPVYDGNSSPGGHWPIGTQIFEHGTEWRAGLKDKKGGDPSEWPEDLRVREFPRIIL